MNTRVYATIRWLQRSGSMPLLVTIIASALVSVALIDDGGAARPVTIVSMAVLGIALVLGCLFAFPYAGIWHDDHHAGSAQTADVAAPAVARPTAEDHRKFVNELRTMLISIGAFPRPRATGRWPSTSGVSRSGRRTSARGGTGSRRSRAGPPRTTPWSGSARWASGPRTCRPPLSVVGSNKGDLPDKLDLRDADLQGATLGRAQLPGALFSGAHLDYLDVRTGEEPYANFAGAEFKGTSLYGAYFNNVDLSEANFDTPIGADGTLRTTQRTDLRHAHFRGATATSVSFKAADLRWANFTATKGRRATLRGADFRGALLTEADFRGAKIDGVNLTGAILTGAKFP
jgi:hypothetical protein